MKFREIVRFEFVYQARRVRTWLYFAVLFVVAYLLTKSSIDSARDGGALVNSPYGIAATTVISGLLWVVMAAAVAGSAAARDAQTRMNPLIYTTPVSKADYLGGRLLAAFVLNAVILLAVPAGMLLALLVPGVEPEILSPFRLAAYLSAYAVMALPTAFAVTATQFSLAALNRRAVASYIGSVLVFVPMSIVAAAVAEVLRMPTLGKLLDPIGYMTVLGMLSKAWTPIEKNTLLIGLQGWMLANRVVWLGVALGVVAFTHWRFRFSHPTSVTRWIRIRQALAQSPTPAGAVIARSTLISIPQVRRTFGFATHARQTLRMTRESFLAIATSRVGLVLLALLAMVVALGVSVNLQLYGVPLLPRTEGVLRLLASPLTNSSTPWVIIPLLIVFCAGELVWRERDAGLDEITDATPVPEWVLLLGRFVGLGLILVAWTALLTMAGMLAQVVKGYHEFEVGLYLRALFGLQLADHLLFALLAIAVHVMVGEKYLGYLAALIAYACIVFASRLGIEHNLLVYGSDPGWSYSDMRGFGPSLGAWMWFKLYWTAWALLLAVTARLLWVRGKERDLRRRLQLARQRFAGATAGVAATAVGLILALGGFIFYNTNVLNAYETAADRMERGAEYERRYGRYEGIPQPRLAATILRVEIYPERREAKIRGTYRLVNDSAVAIESIHLATAAQVETRAVSVDRPVKRVLDDEEVGHRIYDLEQPLQPGDSLRLDFEVHYQPRGFRHSGVDALVVANGTYFTNRDWLPAIGYQPNRELSDVGARKQYGLAPRALFPSLDDLEARRIRVGGDRLTFEAVVGTSGDQIAIAPGTLRRTWTEGGRRYFHYVADVPINNRYAVFSAGYAVHEARWNDPSTSSGQVVAIQIYHHPGHAATLDRMVASVRASLEHFTRQFGPYPYSYLRLIENPTRGMGAHAEATTVDYGVGFSLLNPGDGNFDLVFAVVAHEVAHQWWGMQVTPAYVEGAGLLDESLATYSAMQLVENALGPEHLRRYVLFMREEYRNPRTRAAPPLLRATDSFAFYRKGPFALYAMREYIGKERVDDALRRLFEKHHSGASTSLDLYRELQAVTPIQYQSLLHDLFEKNTFWEVATERVRAEPTANGEWRVTLDVRARKVVVDEAGVETEVRMDDWMEVRVFGEGEPSVQKHRIRSGEQTITLMVPHKPVRAGIDPRFLIVEWGETEENIEAVTIASS
jgi:ABC-2 type transport system permease protein